MTAESESPELRRVAKDLQKVLGSEAWNIRVSDEAAYNIARHILQPDNKISKRERVPRDVWEQNGYQKWHKKSVTHALVSQALLEGFYPIALPDIKLHYYESNHIKSEIPPEIVEQGHPWDFVEVSCSLKVRTSP